jgi:para-nitrobenzyl esterase
MVDIPGAVGALGTSFAKTTLLLGTNGNEGSIFTSPLPFNGVPVSSDAEYQAAVTRTFPSQATQILAQYPSSSFTSPNDALNAVATDAFFACPARRVARAAAGAGSTVYLYVFAHAPEKPSQMNLGSYHSAELPYVFGIDTGLAVTQSDEKPLASLVQGYWTAFARTGDPNGAGAPNWPTYAASGDQDMTLDLPTSAAAPYYKKTQCDFWDTLYP